MKKLFLIPNRLVFAATLGLAAGLNGISCAGAVETPPVTPAPGCIVMFGDSTTALRPKKVEHVYTERVAAALSSSYPSTAVINAGVGGNTTRDARARFGRDVLARKPAIVVIQFGINDSIALIWKKPPILTPRVPLEEYEANLRALISDARAEGISVVLMTTNPLRWTDELRGYYGGHPYDVSAVDGLERTFLAKYNEAVRRVAADCSVPLVDVNKAFHEAATRSHQPVDALLLDGMHPNDAGHEVVTQSLVPVLRTLLQQPGLPRDSTRPHQLHR